VQRQVLVDGQLEVARQGAHGRERSRVGEHLEPAERDVATGEVDDGIDPTRIPDAVPEVLGAVVDGDLGPAPGSGAR
jgi:hypothetical protein